MMTHLPVAEKHLIERGWRSRGIARSPAADRPLSRSAPARYRIPIERRRAVVSAERKQRLSEAARRQGAGAWPLYNPATLQQFGFAMAN